MFDEAMFARVKKGDYFRQRLLQALEFCLVKSHGEAVLDHARALLLRSE